MRWLAVAILCAAATTARADGYRAVVDRAELDGGRLRVYVSALSAGGQLLDLTEPGAIHARIDGAEVGAPYALARFAAQPVDTEVVLVVEVAPAYADALPAITDALARDVVGALPDRARVAVVPYAATAGRGALGTLASARQHLAELAATTGDAGDGEPALGDAVSRALDLLAATHATRARQLVIVAGDGRDASAQTRARIVALGDRARAANVRVHTLAYAPDDHRRPLLALGELSKRSLGTLRWVRGARAESWDPATAQLADELARQYVVTFVVGGGAAAGARLAIATTGRVAVASNTVVVSQLDAPAPDEPAHHGWLIAGGIAALAAVLAIAARRRR
jgi:hypothetical protein|nr:vWA domain-containing protein [Kofleriaceae bacterium]